MILNIKMLPDGSGRVCIHWLMYDAEGPIQQVPHYDKRLAAMTVKRGCIACRPQQNSVNPVDRDGEHLMCMHSPEVRAVTCPACLATVEAKAAMAGFANTMELSGAELSGMMEEKPVVSHEIPPSVVDVKSRLSPAMAKMIRK